MSASMRVLGTFLLFLNCMCHVVWPAAATCSASEPIPGIGPVGEIRQLETGFAFTEGPATDRQGNLFFTDIPKARIHKLNSQGELSTLTDQSGHANGLMFDAAGELVVCEMDGQVVVRNLQTGARRIWVATYQNKRFNAPNDLVLDSGGGVYFTDPSFRSPKPLPQNSTSVYYASATGEVTRLIDELPNPNGILLSTDEQTLYVFPSGQPVMRAYRVLDRGKLDAGRNFCTLQSPPNGGFRGADGATLDVQGNLYITSQLGVQVFNPEGKLLGLIELPEQPSNVTFGGRDGKTLIATARTSVYAAPMHVVGHRYDNGGKQ